MDNFMEKIAQKLGAQEAIRANAAADAAQMEKLEAQVAEYDACMKEMRKLNLKNAENEQKLQELLKESKEQLNQMMEKNSEQLGQLMEKNGAQLSRLMEESSTRLEQLAEECVQKVKGTESEAERTEAIKALLDEMKASGAADAEKIDALFKESDEFVHKENVKVYRNVQAVVVEELEKQTQALMDSQQASASKTKAILIVGIVSAVLAAANLGVLAAHLAGLF